MLLKEMLTVWYIKKDTNFCCLTENIENIILGVVKFYITKLISLFW